MVTSRGMVLVLGALLAGCVAPLAPDPSGDAARGAAAPRVFVGLMDSGVNPYHEVFAHPAAVLPPDVLDAVTSRPPVQLQLTQVGSWDERFAADAAMWASLEPWTLYWFVGTRVLALSLLEPGAGHMVLHNPTHGTAVASVLRNLSADSWIVMVQHANPMDRGETADTVLAKAGRGVGWLAAQPWVDIISLSFGVPGNPPMPLLRAYAEATRSAAEGGKLVVGAAVNVPTPTTQSEQNGPPWMITVGGAEASTQGLQPDSGQVVDVVADSTRAGAGLGLDDYRRSHGTSISAPVVAGTLAEALLQLRRAADHPGGIVDGVLCPCGGRSLSNDAFRGALNASAVYFETAAWDPLNYSDDPVELLLFPTAPAAPTPWVQMGWGYVGDGTWRVLVDALTGAAVPPAKPEAARMHMAAQQALREAYWSR